MAKDFDIILGNLDKLEKRIFWLEKWKKEQDRKEYIEEIRRRSGE
jgi:hypothetical protein